MATSSFLASYGSMLAAAIAGLVGLGIALVWSKYPIRWILAIATIVLVVFVFIGFKYDPNSVDPFLPSTFRLSLQLWLFALGLVALYSITHLVFTLVRVAFGSVVKSGSDESFAEIQNSWQDLLIQLSQAKIDLASQDLYLLLTPEESLASSVVNAAGLQFFASGPASPEAPIHGYATSDALFLSIGGASSLGSQGADGPARLEFLCRLIEAANPERPILRGIAILIPFEWTKTANFLRQVSAIREDLQMIRRSLKVRCPTLTVCCLTESIHGFNDFAARLPVKLRQNRCGFSVPGSRSSHGEVIGRGMLWMTRWFQAWTLNLMVADIDNPDNSRLLSMNVEIRKNRESLVRLLESGLTMHKQAEPVLYRGCYFVACGPTPDRHAFAAGLLSGARKGRLLADRDLTTWSRESDRLDRNYRRAAWALGIASAAIALPIWLQGIIPWLDKEAKGTIGWVSLAALIVLWVVMLVARQFKKPATTG